MNRFYSHGFTISITPLSPTQAKVRITNGEVEENLELTSESGEFRSFLDYYVKTFLCK